MSISSAIRFSSAQSNLSDAKFGVAVKPAKLNDCLDGAAWQTALAKLRNKMSNRSEQSVLLSFITHRMQVKLSASVDPDEFTFFLKLPGADGNRVTHIVVDAQGKIVGSPMMQATGLQGLIFPTTVYQQVGKTDTNLEIQHPLSVLNAALRELVRLEAY